MQERQNYEITVHQWFGDKIAQHFSLRQEGSIPAADLAEAAKTAALVRKGRSRHNQLYLFNARYQHRVVRQGRQWPPEVRRALPLPRRGPSGK